MDVVVFDCVFDDVFMFFEVFVEVCFVLFFELI